MIWRRRRCNVYHGRILNLYLPILWHQKLMRIIGLGGDECCNKEVRVLCDEEVRDICGEKIKGTVEWEGNAEVRESLWWGELCDENMMESLSDEESCVMRTWWKVWVRRRAVWWEHDRKSEWWGELCDENMIESLSDEENCVMRTWWKVWVMRRAVWWEHDGKSEW